MANGQLNFSVYGECGFIAENIDLKKQTWQTTVSILVIIICATRLFLEILELFQVNFAKYVHFRPLQSVKNGHLNKNIFGSHFETSHFTHWISFEVINRFLF